MAIVVALLVAACALAIREPRQAGLAIAFATGLSAVALVGLIDDHRPLSPWIRLPVHVVASAVLALAWIANGGDWKAAAVAFIACICLTNIWNFMDGIDGLAATQAAIAALAIVFATTDEQPLLALALAASCIGFLPFNFPRSRIFLGDVGSGALGFAIAALWLPAADDVRMSSTLIPMAVSAFVIDAGLTLLRRVLRGERWWTPHVQHAYQVCARRWGHARVTISYGVWTGVSALIAQGMEDVGTALPWAMMAAWYTSGAVLWFWLQHCQVGRSRTIDRKDGTKADRT